MIALLAALALAALVGCAREPFNPPPRIVYAGTDSIPEHVRREADSLWSIYIARRAKESWVPK